MKEEDYILVRDLSSILNAINILRDIVAVNSSIIDEEDLRIIRRKLTDWEDEHFRKIQLIKQ